jgi:hypothetical protein
MEEDLVLQFITVLSFSSSLLIVCILFFSFFLGVLGCSWWLVEKRWRVGGRGGVLAMGVGGCLFLL